jgi:hypothetical protein
MQISLISLSFLIQSGWVFCGHAFLKTCAISYLVSSAVWDGREVRNGSFSSEDDISCEKMSV